MLLFSDEDCPNIPKLQSTKNYFVLLLQNTG